MAFDATSTAMEVTEGLDLEGRTALVTGATSGIGFETARVLALRGAHVLVLGRTRTRAMSAADFLPGRVSPLAADFADFDSVADCAARVRRLGVPLDIIVCNAGIMAPPRLELVRGLERQFVVNHLAHFILVNRLLDQVRAAPAGRIVMVSSRAHHWAPAAGIDFDNLTGAQGYDPRMAYGQSKLANGLFGIELARRLADTSITVNVAQPGLLLTRAARYLPVLMRLVAPILAALLPGRVRTVGQAAATVCYLAAHPAVEKVTGRYFADCQVAEPSPMMNDAALAARLWDVSVELTGAWL